MSVDIYKAQRRLLEMGKSTASILESHGIPYSISCGTLIGAVRHQGFIPWDADFDLYLFSDSYDDAISILRKELPDDMFVEDSQSEPLYFHGWAHVKDLKSDTKCYSYPHDNIYAHHGLHIDLYRLVKVDVNDVDNYLNSQNREYIMRRRALNIMSDEEYEIRIQKLLEAERISATRERVPEREVFTRTTSYKCKMFEYGDVLPLRKYKFEDTEFFGVNNAHNVLTDQYGDYLTLPPEEKRACGYDDIAFLD